MASPQVGYKESAKTPPTGDNAACFGSRHLNTRFKAPSAGSTASASCGLPATAVQHRGSVRLPWSHRRVAQGLRQLHVEAQPADQAGRRTARPEISSGRVHYLPSTRRARKTSSAASPLRSGKAPPASSPCSVAFNLGNSECHSHQRPFGVPSGRGVPEAEKPDQEAAEGCKRLIKNAIIFWNYL